MENSKKKIEIFVKFRPYLHLLRAYNPENCHHNNWRCNLHSISLAFGATLFIYAILLVDILIVWLLLENDADAKAIVVSMPIVCSFLLASIAYVALLTENRVISETIERIQNLVDQRELRSISFLNKILSLLGS